MAGKKTRPGDGRPETYHSPATDALDAEATSILKAGSVYEGRVAGRRSDGTYEVDVERPKASVTNVRLASPVLGGIMGFNARCNLASGTPVKLVYGPPSFIFATGVDAANPAATPGRSVLWGALGDTVSGVEDQFADNAQDLLEGELEIANLFGVAIDMLTTLMRMRAGDRAAVECHLINDMVRVISAQYRHISGIGDDLIFDHGRPTMERGWSSYRHELMGALEDREPLAELDGDQIDRASLEPGRVIDAARYRLVEFIGFAGDFIHSFVQDPPATINKMVAGLAQDGAGKSWVHRNSDGSVIVQSVADIRLERVCRIPVPVRHASHEDPAITAARDYESLEREYLDLPAAVAGEEGSEPDLFKVAYHIRSYARWLSRYHAFARMLQLNYEYTIPSEAGAAVPSPTNAERDRREQNAAATHIEAYACIAIHRDGSIVLHDGYGSAIMCCNGNVQISAARHLHLEAAGDVLVLAGGSFVVKARRNVELSAALGGIILHSYAWLKMLCERGSLWLRSNAKTDKDEAPRPRGASDGSPAGHGGPTPEVAGWVDGESDGAAVLVEAGEGKAVWRSHKGSTIMVDGTPTDKEDSDYDVVVGTAGSARVAAMADVSLAAGDGVAISAARAVAMATPTVISSASEMYVGGSDPAKPQLALSGGRLYCGSMQAGSMEANSMRTRRNTGEIPDPDLSPEETLKPHYGHVSSFQPEESVVPPENTNDASLAAMETAKESAPPAAVPWGSPADGPRWGFAAGDEYAWDDREEEKGSVPETLTQQYLRLDADPDEVDRWGGPGYEAWKVDGWGLEGRRVRGGGGLGSAVRVYQADDQGENLHAPTSTEPGSTPQVKISWTAKLGGFTMRVLRRIAP